MTATTRDVTIPAATLKGSAFPTIHRSGGPIRDALASLSDYREVAGRMAHLAGVLPSQGPMASLEIEIEELLCQAAESRSSLDLDAVTAHAALVRDRLTTHQALNAGLESASRRYTEELDAVVRQNAPRLYRHLGGQLVDVIELARGMADLVDADAADAIAADRVPDWQALNELRERFRSIRAAHGKLNQHVGAPIEHLGWAELQWISNPEDAWEDWAPWRADGAIVNPANLKDRTPLASPWPDPRNGARDLADGWFGYLVRTPQAKPWAPTPRQHDEAARGLLPVVAEVRQSKGNPRKAKGIRR